MAREEHRREDLLREATALVQRIELGVPIGDGTVVIGFRANGAASFFFDEQPVYQFNAAQQLRRAFVAGLLYKAVGGCLVSLERHRFSDRLELRRHELSSVETDRFLADAWQHLEQLRHLLADGNFTLRGVVPQECDVLQRAVRWLDSTLSHPLEIAHTPRVGT